MIVIIGVVCSYANFQHVIRLSVFSRRSTHLDQMISPSPTTNYLQWRFFQINLACVYNIVCVFRFLAGTYTRIKGIPSSLTIAHITVFLNTIIVNRGRPAHREVTERSLLRNVQTSSELRNIGRKVRLRRKILHFTGKTTFLSPCENRVVKN